MLKLLLEGRCPRNPGGCNRNHNPKALEHLTGLPNPQPSHVPPVPCRRDLRVKITQSKGSSGHLGPRPQLPQPEAPMLTGIQSNPLLYLLSHQLERDLTLELTGVRI